MKLPFFRLLPGDKMSDIKIAVQEAEFDQNSEYRWLSQSDSVGASVIFVGKVRDLNLGDEVSSLYLEHYPAMTEKALNEIVAEAKSRWDIQRVVVIHRVGLLHTGDEIVLVGVSSAHRGDAYHANEFIMDYLKTKAPFWKKEKTDKGERWIESRDSDQQAAEKW
ncbi:molybdopterin synthase subunit MoaE [Basfia succiniciproducens]|uniref:Molybdopterin synthase catalytic subunit n=2 Tax=Basfia succiniciproducens TaxID=653940 RepID=A0A1G5BLX8_9PAST|nr:molybdopterin synthase subunit MoaE [Basfia succiniciproducens]SEQ54574.1 molybdopterin synthase subunit MoaE [Basfia succiniciproducens]